MRLTKRQLIDILGHSDLDYFPETELALTKEGCIITSLGNIQFSDEKIVFDKDELNQKYIQKLLK